MAVAPLTTGIKFIDWMVTAPDEDGVYTVGGHAVWYDDGVPTRLWFEYVNSDNKSTEVVLNGLVAQVNAAYLAAHSGP